jgi:hypothetical protein
MDFRVTHFLVADSTATDNLANKTASTSINAVPNGRIGVVTPLASDPTVLPDYSSTVAAAAAGTPIQLVQGLDTTDAIQKEMGLIKSGIIDTNKIVSVRKMFGSNDYSRQVKVFGSTVSTAYSAGTSTNTTAFAVGTAGTAGRFYHVVGANGLPTRVYKLTAQDVSGNYASTPTHLSGSVTIAGATSGSGTFEYVDHYYDTTTFPVASLSVNENGLTVPAPSSTTASLSLTADKEYSFSVRIRSAIANTLSPFGLLRGYSAFASDTFVSSTGVVTTNNAYTAFSTGFGIVKNFALDGQISEFAKVYAIITNKDSGSTVTSFILGKDASAPTFLSATQGGVSATYKSVSSYSTWLELVRDLTVTCDVSGAVAGTNFTLTFVVEGLAQSGFINDADLTLFPYKWDFVKLNGYFQEGPYHDRLSFTGSGQPLNSGITTQTPVVFDRTASGTITEGTIAVNPVIVNSEGSGKDIINRPGYPVIYNSTSTTYVPYSVLRFPNLTQREIKFLAHEYQSYSNKYKQQFQGIKYNAMVMDPQQAKINYAGSYNLYYIEYLPYADFSYTSTQSMPQLTVVAVPQNLSTLNNELDTVFGTSNITVAAGGRTNDYSL